MTLSEDQLDCLHDWMELKKMQLESLVCWRTACEQISWAVAPMIGLQERHRRTTFCCYNSTSENSAKSIL